MHVRLGLISINKLWGPGRCPHHLPPDSGSWVGGSTLHSMELTVATATGHPRLLLSAWAAPPPSRTGCLSQSQGPACTPSLKSLPPTYASSCHLALVCPTPSSPSLDPGAQLSPALHPPATHQHLLHGKGHPGHLGCGDRQRPGRLWSLLGPPCSDRAHPQPLFTLQLPWRPQHISPTRGPSNPQPKPLALADVQLAVLFGLNWTCRPGSLPGS